MNKLEFVKTAGFGRRSCPAGRKTTAASIVLPALLLAGCVGDMRGSDVTRPRYTNPLDELQADAAAEPEQPQTAVAAGRPARVRYVQALENDTARTIAERVGADPEQVAEMNDLFPDAPLSAGRILVVPTGDGIATPEEISRIASSALEGGPDDALPVPGGGSPAGAVKLRDPFAEEDGLPPPPAAKEPLPEDIEIAGLPASPDFSQYQSAARFQFPVQGDIIRGYSEGPGGNEGIDIAAPAGSPVVAAEDGEVALLSQSKDDTAILLIRHPDNLYTVYSNLKNITVEKGQKVTRGQNLGAVADGDKEFLHFEVRVGTESTDPMPYIL